jgi:hypothetical protein
MGLTVDVVSDSVTGLVWIAEPVTDVTTRAEAELACSQFGDELLGGRSDWRLPSRRELASLLDAPGFDAGGPLAPAFAPLPDGATAWTATSFAGQTGSSFAMNDLGWFYFYDDDTPLAAGHAYCVAGTPNEASSFSLSATMDTVLDQTSGLEWQRAQSADPMALSAALAYCEGLGLGGFDDWRLPTIKEATSLVVDDQASPAIPPLFTGSRVWNWTSTPSNNPFASEPNFHAYESMSGTTSGRDYGEAEIQGARCVRGPR